MPSKDNPRPAHSPGGEHEDDLESGMPHDKSEAQVEGSSDHGVGVKPSGHETALEEGDYPEPGEGVTGRPTAARGLSTPSRGNVGGVQAKGTMGDGRGESGKYVGTMGDGARGEPKAKGCVGQ